MPDEPNQTLSTTIGKIGAKGDGVAIIEGSSVHVSFALPGEIVSIRRNDQRGDLISINTASPERVPPICQHFGACGGCSLQHWDSAAYASWKKNLVISALSGVGLQAPTDQLREYPVASRRRATFSAHKSAGSVQLGYKGAKSHEVVHLHECSVLLPAIVGMLLHLQKALAITLRSASEARIYVAAAANGIDCVIDGPALERKARATLADVFSRAGVIRALWNGELIYFQTQPIVNFGNVAVKLPAGAFLQAVEACERDMASFVVDALQASKLKGPICDLFAGLGAFSLPCAKLAPVTAYEMDGKAVSAMQAAAREAKGLKPLQAIQRDLYRNPLSVLELNRFEAVIIDPPREGAEAQCSKLSASKTKTVMMLSCNPITFGRDAALLHAGGFELVRVALFDQFRYAAHVEIAAVFRRGTSKPRLS